jgi:hypothetical protein
VGLGPEILLHFPVDRDPAGLDPVARFPTGTVAEVGEELVETAHGFRQLNHEGREEHEEKPEGTANLTKLSPDSSGGDLEISKLGILNLKIPDNRDLGFWNFRFSILDARFHDFRVGSTGSAFHLGPNAQQRFIGGDVEGLMVGVAERAVGGRATGEDRAEVLACGADH